MPAYLLVRSISPFPLPVLLLHCNGRLRNLRIFYIFYEMRMRCDKPCQSVFLLTLTCRFNPHDNLYTMLVRHCLLQFITKAYLSQNVNTRGASAGKSPSGDRCGFAAVNAQFASLAPAVAVPPPRTFPWTDRLCWLSLSKRNC